MISPHKSSPCTKILYRFLQQSSGLLAVFQGLTLGRLCHPEARWSREATATAACTTRPAAACLCTGASRPSAATNTAWWITCTDTTFTPKPGERRPALVWMIQNPWLTLFFVKLVIFSPLTYGKQHDWEERKRRRVDPPLTRFKPIWNVRRISRFYNKVWHLHSDAILQSYWDPLREIKDN